MDRGKVFFIYGVLILIFISSFTIIINKVAYSHLSSHNQEVLSSILDSVSTSMETHLLKHRPSQTNKKESLAIFWKTLKNTRIGETGETYLVSKDGVLLSPSRYRSFLVEKDLVNENLSEARNFVLKTPNGKDNIMTSQIKNKISGCNTDGYKDYRGVEVIGCWKWLEFAELGIVSEMDKSESHRAYYVTKRTVCTYALLSFLLLISALFYVHKIIDGNFLVLKKQKKLAEDMEKKTTEALAFQKEFTSNISHEVRTPLNGLIGSLDLLQDGPLNEEQEKRIRVAKESSLNLKVILDDILEYSKLESGTLNLKEVDFDIDDLFEELISLFQDECDSKRINLVWNIENDIPKILIGDKGKIRQVLVNLISNAVKYTFVNGEIKVHVSKGAQEDSELYLEILVSDNGIGIRKENQKRIFEAFRQEDTSMTRAFGGTGIGLAIVSKLINILKGNIELESEHGKGANFKVSIPVHVSSQEKTRSQDDNITELGEEFLKKKILLVEDNSANRLVAKGFLKKIGLSPDIVENGKEAVIATRNKNYDLIFMDIQMPVMNGIDATQVILNEQGKDGPSIVALTANAFNEEREGCIKVGMKDFISKPFSKRDLVEAIKKYS